MIILNQWEIERLWFMARAPGLHRESLGADVQTLARAVLTLGGEQFSLDRQQSASQAQVGKYLLEAFRKAGPDVLRLIQTALAAGGYDPGPIDGEWGPATARALGRYVDRFRQGG